jgi:hypothetical protein
MALIEDLIKDIPDPPYSRSMIGSRRSGLDTPYFDVAADISRN